MEQQTLLDVSTQPSEQQKTETEINQEQNPILGFVDAGFDQARLDDLHSQLQQTTQEREDYLRALAQEREELAKEFDRHRKIAVNFEKSPLDNVELRELIPRRSNNDPEDLAATQARRARETRWKQLSWGLDSRRNKLYSKQKDLELAIFGEKDKRSDSIDLAEVYEELKENDMLPEVKYDLESDRVILSQAESEPFQEEKLREYHDEYARKIAERTPREIWFHTTNQLNRMVENGGISTQSWIKKHDEEYHRTLSQNSVASRNRDIDPESSSPFGEWDSDRMFFRSNALEVYGSRIIAYAPEDLLVDTNLFFLPDGVQHMDERVISDIVVQSGDRLPSNGESNLQIAFDKAHIAVKKLDYRETCRRFLLAGYSREWIAAHVFSYRGEGEKHYEGMLVAAKEIKKRIQSIRKQQKAPEIFAVPNSEPIYGAHVYQLSTEQRVLFTDKEESE